MFLVYLRRELRRRIRQAIFIALGLALGIGLVITVVAASDGVQNSQAAVLHALYGVGTDITVTEPPARGSSVGTTFGFTQEVKNIRTGVVAPGTKISTNSLATDQYGIINSGVLAKIARQPGVTGAAGGLVLNDLTVTGTVPQITVGNGLGSYRSSFTSRTFNVDGVDPADTALGPLSSGKISSGSTLTAAEANADDAVVGSGYAAQNKLAAGGTIDVGGTNFKIIGVVTTPQSGDPPDVYIPLAKAQQIGKNGSSALTGDVDTIYVTAGSAADIPAVQAGIGKLLPSATVTDSSDLASEVTGSLSSASSLASNLGRWLSLAALVAAFGVASLLTMTAVARRVREFGTLKALGWPTRRIVAQVIGESLAIGLAGAAVGVCLGYVGTFLIGKLAPKLSATVGPANGSSVTGPGQALGTAASSTLKALTSGSHTVSVPLTAPVTADLILIAVVLAIGGGLIAGMFGGWRAARMRPADALARVE
ncbi:MAG TPA: ABC transporter permease [Streptosporangiaceae bacterium]|nr:ABC transporter permease [Streptosporangiaceae bacterium]